MRDLNKSIIASLLCCLLGSTRLLADPGPGATWQDRLSVDGFFTVDASLSDSDIAVIGGGKEFRRYEDGNLNAENSLLGAQLGIRLTDHLSATVQGSLFADRDGDPDSSLDWAYLSYDFGSDFTARLGRFQPAFLSGTELRRIGISRLWARPLIPGSGASGFNEYHGVDLIKRFNRKDHHWQLQFAAGNAKHDVAAVDGKRMSLFGAEYRHRSLWIRAALMHVEFGFASNTGERLSNSADALLGSLEAEFNWRNLQFNLGLSEGNTDFTPDDSMRYLSVARDFGNLKPYLFATRREQDFERLERMRQPPQSTSGASMLPPPPGGPRPAPQPGASPPSPNLPPTGIATVDSAGLGLRWDLRNGFALKVQLQHNRERDRTRPDLGLLSNDANVATITVEAVF